MMSLRITGASSSNSSCVLMPTARRISCARQSRATQCKATLFLEGSYVSGAASISDEWSCAARRVLVSVACCTGRGSTGRADTVAIFKID